MDLLLLGSESRKTRIRAREDIRRDKYDMEDIDEFFDDDEEPELENEKTSYVDDLARSDKIPNFARKINFTDAEAESFNLSPVSITSKSATQRNVDSPLRSPLQEHLKENLIQLESDFVREEEDRLSTSNEGMTFENDLNANEVNDFVDFDEYGYDELSSPKNVITKTNDTGDFGDDVLSVAKSLTKNIALGKSKPRRNLKRVVYLDDDLDEADQDTGQDDFVEVTTPRMTRKRQAVKRSRPAQVQAETIITRPSPLPSPPPDGLRRSKRTRIAPLAHWRNERIVYSRATEYDIDPDTTLASDIRKIPLQEIKEVVHVPENVETLGASSRKRSRSNKTKTSHVAKDVYDYESDPEISGSEWFKDDQLELEVFEGSGSEVKIPRVIAWAPGGGQYQDKTSGESQDIDNFKVATLFDLNRNFTAAGLLELPFEGYKSLRNAGDCIFDFHVAKGLVEVTLNNDKFIVTRGCSFEVPNANIYGFRNVGKGDAKLFFVQTRVDANVATENE